MGFLVPPLYEATVTAWIRHHMQRPTITEAELVEAAEAKRCPLFEARRRSPRCPRFDKYRMNRLKMGHIRYGSTGLSRRDCTYSICSRWEDYLAHGNREHLVDIANLAEIEWISPSYGRREALRAVSCRTIPDWIECYRLTGDREALTYVADIAETEWCEPTHPDVHWAPLDTGGPWSLRARQ